MGFNIFWGDYLREIRKSHNLTQKEIASVLHIKRQTYSNFETGRCHPSPEILAVLSNVYDINLFDHALKCMPSVYLEEQHDFKYGIQTGNFAIKKAGGRKAYPTYRGQSFSEYNKNHTE